MSADRRQVSCCDAAGNLTTPNHHFGIWAWGQLKNIITSTGSGKSTKCFRSQTSWDLPQKHKNELYIYSPETWTIWSDGWICSMDECSTTCVPLCLACGRESSAAAWHGSHVGRTPQAVLFICSHHLHLRHYASMYAWAQHMCPHTRASLLYMKRCRVNLCSHAMRR